jgi:hypothetical protein
MRVLLSDGPIVLAWHLRRAFDDALVDAPPMSLPVPLQSVLMVARHDIWTRELLDCPAFEAFVVDVVLNYVTRELTQDESDIVVALELAMRHVSSMATYERPKQLEHEDIVALEQFIPPDRRAERPSIIYWRPSDIFHLMDRAIYRDPITDKQRKASMKKISLFVAKVLLSKFVVAGFTKEAAVGYMLTLRLHSKIQPLVPLPSNTSMQRLGYDDFAGLNDFGGDHVSFGDLLSFLKTPENSARGFAKMDFFIAGFETDFEKLSTYR